ncbi:MAG: molybdate ABC transporter permease subunit [Polyangiaceae bacterium]|nr:molybdate ABC transporter permease subunit [Polyangiaceae bacterium]
MTPPSHGDLAALGLTLELATVTTAVLLAIGTPTAYWLARTRSRWRNAVSAFVGLPLVLPPTVLGFYLLVWLGPGGAIGRMTTAIGMGTLPFTFAGLVVASTIYSLPFVVQPLQGAFETVGRAPLDLAATLGAGPWDRFFTVTLPLARSGFVVAAVLAFAHTIGEFGVVLMIGGNIPGQTRVLSIALYDHVEALEYPEAHRLAFGLVAFSFIVLFALQHLRANAPSFRA